VSIVVLGALAGVSTAAAQGAAPVGSEPGEPSSEATAEEKPGGSSPTEATGLGTAQAAGPLAPGTQRLTEALAIEGPPDPQRCVTEAALVERIRGWLGRNTVDARLAIRVKRDEDRLSFDVVKPGEAPATRQFTELPQSCSDRLSAVSLALALAIDATLLETLGVPAPTEPPARPSAPGPRTGTGWIVGVDAAAQLWWNVLPALTTGFQAGLSIRHEGLALEGSFIGSLRSDSVLASGRADARLLGGRLDGCLHREWGRFAVRGCAALAAGRVSAVGQGFDQSLSSNLPWVAGLLRVAGRARVAGPLGLQVAVDGVFPVVRPELEVRDTTGFLVDSRSFAAAGIMAGAGIFLAFE
jgi:hypothetical protein